MNSKAQRCRVARSLLVLLLCIGSTACMRDPFLDQPLTSEQIQERLLAIEPLSFEQYKAVPKEKSIIKKPLQAPAHMEITLAQCRAWAMENNLDLRVALVDPAIAQTNVTQEEARFESVLFSNLGYSDTQTPTASDLDGSETSGANGSLGVRIPTRTGGSVTVDFAANRFETDNSFATLNPSFDSDMSISLSHELLRNAGLRVNTAPLQIARLSAQSTYVRTKIEVIRTLATVDRAYWLLYSAQRELEVRLSQHELAKAQLERARRLVDQGSAAEVEIIRAESGVADGLEAIIISENQLRLRQRDLKRLLNHPDLPINGPTQLQPLTPAIPVEYDLPTDELVDLAMDGRLELLEIELQMAQDALNIEVARNATLPLAAFEYRYTRNGLGGNFGSAFEQGFNDNFDAHAVNLRIEVPLGNQAARAALDRALLTRLQRSASANQREAQVRQEVLDAADSLQAAWQRVLASRQSAILAARVFAAEQRQFEQDLNTSTDVQDAQTRFADAQSNEIRALVDYQIAQIDLAFATGTILGSAQIRWAPIDQTQQE